ncbi:DUF4437 domain-containing protein [Roseibacillus persicicus]|uniref:DUF4437 domain-containing protein n=1 Tax=Roseibacillus persicicus TaxID=454148 RepID=UPI00280E8B57|nr:DUF4437 domain-containing protein [Roseibacillus persicicus]MDQ8191881.1 DUF4437 domain-containing protein [Roseibacillus persicicus]
MKTKLQSPKLQKALTTGLPLAVLGLVTVSSSDLLFGAEEKSKSKALTPTQNEIVLSNEVEWTPLNPARGDKGPQAGTLWGDRAANEQTGFLIKFADGFSSPPHIHNITYRGVVMSGEVHNDDPAAEKMWLPAGSYWTQPAGEVHITAAQGENNMAFLEIEEGPYLVLPSEQANDNGERPVNMHEKNIVWLNAADSSWLDIPDSLNPEDGPQITYTWGSPKKGQISGALVKLPAGFTGTIQNSGTVLRAVVIQGAPDLQLADSAESVTLLTGSYFASAKGAIHQVTGESDKETLLYIRSNGGFKVTQNEN